MKKAKRKLGREPNTIIGQLVEMMVESRLRLAEREQLADG